MKLSLKRGMVVEVTTGEYRGSYWKVVDADDPPTCRRVLLNAQKRIVQEMDERKLRPSECGSLIPVEVANRSARMA
jgi:hypothetical protein